MAPSPETMPPGWGYGKQRRNAAAAPAVEPPTPPRRKATRVRRSNDRTMHMRFALWAHGLGRIPLPGETCDHLGVNYETARRLVFDWNRLTKEQP